MFLKILAITIATFIFKTDKLSIYYPNYSHIEIIENNVDVLENAVFVCSYPGELRLIKKGKIQKNSFTEDYGKHIAVVKLDDKFCIIKSNDNQYLSTFVQTLKKIGVKEAIYIGIENNCYFWCKQYTNKCILYAPKTNDFKQKLVFYEQCVK